MPIASPYAPWVLAMLEPHFIARPQVIVAGGNGNGSLNWGAGWDLTGQLKELTIQQSVDNATGSIDLVFKKGKADKNLNPLVAAGLLSRLVSGKPTLEAHNAVIINFEVGYGSLFPTGTVMQGRIDDVSLAGEDIAVECRDRGGYINESSIKQSTMYGSLAGIPLETVLGQMLTDWGWDASDLYVPVSPGFDVYPFPQDRAQLLDAMRTAVLQIGWDLRYRPGTPSALTLYDPDRTRTVPDAVFDKTRYISIRELKLGDADVRNMWDMHWQSLDGMTHGPVHVEDADSILRYGTKYAALWLQRGDLIRSDEAAARYMAAALADSKDPLASHVVEMPLYLNVALNDIHTYRANGKDYDTDLTFAVTGYTHHWSAEPDTMPTTTITCRQKPMAALREYRPWDEPRKVVAALDIPDNAIYAPEGTIWGVVDSLD